MAITLGISPGTRQIGIAVFHDDELMEWRVMTFRKEWSADKRRQIAQTLEMLFDINGIDAVSVKIPDTIPSSKAYAQVLGVINVLCEQRGIKGRYYTLTDLKWRLMKDKDANKERLTAWIVERYPELLPEYRKGIRVKAYYSRLFEAVAAGLIAVRT